MTYASVMSRSTGMRLAWLTAVKRPMMKGAVRATRTRSVDPSETPMASATSRSPSQNVRTNVSLLKLFSTASAQRSNRVASGRR